MNAFEILRTSRSYWFPLKVVFVSSWLIQEEHIVKDRSFKRLSFFRLAYSPVDKVDLFAILVK